jgi:hypothetical protein
MSPVPCEKGTCSEAGKVSCTTCASGYQTTLVGSTYCNICGPGEDIFFRNNLIFESIS